jgi:malate permease and related proteins
MEQLLFHIGNVVLPIFLCVAAGFAIARFNLPFDKTVAGSLVANIGYPALVLSHLAAQHVSFGPFMQMLLAALVMVVAFGVISYVFLRLCGLSVRAFLSPMMMNNTGNVGLPVCALALGNAGLAYGLAFVVVVLAGLFTVGIWIPQGRVTASDLYKKPVIYAVVVAVALMATGTRLPLPLDHTFSILGGLSIPLMLLTLGYTLATLTVGTLWRGVYIAVFHLAMGMAVAYGIVHLLGLSGTERAVVVLMAVMPVSVAAYLWVDQSVPDEAPSVAGYILVSTLLTVVVLPPVLTYWI